jgi:hypothetical protein
MARPRRALDADPHRRMRIELALGLGPNLRDELRGHALTDEELATWWWRLRPKLLAQARAMGTGPPWAYLRFECDPPAERPRLADVSPAKLR